MSSSKRDRTFASLIAAVAQIALLFQLCFSTAHGSEILEYKIKAAYLYNFTKFISWPPKNTSSFNICIIGYDPFGSLLDSLESKTALDKPIRIFRYDNARQAKDCHIIYLDQADPGITIENALMVSSQPLFAESGGMIGFTLENEKVKLHINLKAVKQSGLGISAKLIEVSTLVGEDEHE